MAARPIWNGTLSFGLLNIPIQLMTGERRNELHFRMMDARNKAPVKYERVNAETGEEVPWKEIVKAFEYSKGNYVVLEPEDLAAAASENREVIEMEAFVDREQIAPSYLEKPYILVPGKKAEKGYVLLREVLKKTGKVGIGRVVIRTKEYLTMVTPQDDALMMILLRFPQEIVDIAEYNIPEGGVAKWKISPKELEMATTLLESMAADFDPEQYKDEFKERLSAVIKKRLKQKGATTTVEEEEGPAHDATTNVVDFMALLKKSLEKKGDAPAKATARKAAKKPATKKAATKTPSSKSKKSA
ncbi:non-homologous end joining protein Ku [Lysobacter helvus]|uniref:Non-homologous end joining protein Ku n=2 Tax=Lysobacteraceae TaxID=32033 RepID=A0ABM7Q5I8_9GAMM|nr:MULTISPECIES: Ku protein [Lysobacter]BCT92586.1 non-homologous end joining protein Ku [Lysobacter caseinilyticus]BCT95739.1 non-homologous end joining protein Ku [Lysobacter helvus]